MRRPSLIRIWLFACLAATATLLGCESTPKADNQPLHSPPDAPTPRQAQDGALTSVQMQELLGRLQTLELDNAQLKKKLSDQYMESVELRKAQIEFEKAKLKMASEQAVRPQANANQGQAIETSDAAGGAEPAKTDQLSRDQLLDELIKRITEGKDPDRVKALMAAAISVASDHKQMDPQLLDALDPKSREQVARFHQMLAVAFDELASDKTATLTRREMIRKIDEVFGAQPLAIETLQLCRRVDSYGVYEPFASTRFLAGRKNRVLVYVELENFKHEPLEDGRYEVRLEQSVELFDATGETTVWRQGPVQLVDISRNTRRDFFIVYPIDLPANLAAGGYRLKVRIADKHTGSLCEQTMHDIQIVADQALVGGR